MTAKDGARIEQLKKRIGYSPEPKRDAQGYWCIGYGRRLNDKPGGPRPEAYWSEQFADEELRYRVAAARDALPPVRDLAAMGRGGDTEIAHLIMARRSLCKMRRTSCAEMSADLNPALEMFVH